jgi:hypothetical protein
VLDPAAIGAELVTEHLVATLHRRYAVWWGPSLRRRLRAKVRFRRCTKTGKMLLLSHQRTMDVRSYPLLFESADSKLNMNSTVRDAFPGKVQ